MKSFFFNSYDLIFDHSLASVIKVLDCNIESKYNFSVGPDSLTHLCAHFTGISRRLVSWTCSTDMIWENLILDWISCSFFLFQNFESKFFFLLINFLLFSWYAKSLHCLEHHLAFFLLFLRLREVLLIDELNVDLVEEIGIHWNGVVITLKGALVRGVRVVCHCVLSLMFKLIIVFQF